MLLARFIVGIQRGRNIYSDTKTRKLKVVGKKRVILKSLVMLKEGKHFPLGQ